MAGIMRKTMQGNTAGFEFAEDPDLDVNDITREDILSAYRVMMPTHGLYYGVCKRNCRNNPRCLTGLGEKVWFDESVDDDETEEYALEVELVRSDGIPSGLKNLGNTCYVNSFLQIWFHNSIFRQALYEWDPGEDPEEQDNESILDPELYEPKSKVASLQALFALMQYTKRKYVDPTEFICKLGLNPSVQQDAQEFSKLFVSLLETSLEHQSNQNIRGMIQKLFRGEYAYVTTCLACKRESVRPSYFYELDLALAGNKNLNIEKCIEDFLRIEKMTGDEKYYCESCQSKQEATRCCKLRELPLVLNLQLNRFQYDMQFGRKKKLNSSIMFPQVLDMAKYSENSAGVYHLIGVLMHVGPDANHGHYIAHIQELETGNWYKFSDEHVASLDPKAKVRNVSMKKMRQEPIQQPKIQTSNNAYMLVYMLDKTIQEIRQRDAVEVVKREKVRRLTILKRQCSEGTLNSTEDGGVGAPASVVRGIKRKLSTDSNEDINKDYIYSNCRVFPTSLQQHLRNRIDKDNLEFDEEIEEKRQRRLQIARQKNLKKKKMKDTYKNLLWMNESDELPDESTLEFIPKSWLMDWFSDPSNVGPVETSMYLCVHANLDVDKLGEVKLCSKQGINILVAEFGIGEGPRLTADRLCWICVKNRARLTSLDFRLARDQDFIKHQLRIPTDGKGFWIGKKSLNQWKRMARDALEEQIVKETREANYDDFNEYWDNKTKKKYTISPEVITIDDESSDSLSMDDMDEDEEMLDSELAHLDDEKSESDTDDTIIHRNNVVANNLHHKKELNLSGLKSKLEKIGTNVSLSNNIVNNINIQQQVKSEDIKPSNLKDTENILKPQAGPSTASQPTDTKSAFDSLSGVVKTTKPSCAVKPTIKPPKPSATVRPLNIAECLQAEAENLIKDDSKDEPDSPISMTAPLSLSSSTLISASPSQQRISLPSSNVACHSSPPKKLPVKSVETTHVNGNGPVSSGLSETAVLNINSSKTESNTPSISSSGVGEVKPNLCRVAPSFNSNGSVSAAAVVSASSSPLSASNAVSAVVHAPAPPSTSAKTLSTVVAPVNGICDPNHNMTSPPSQPFHAAAASSAAKASTSSHGSTLCPSSSSLPSTSSTLSGTATAAGAVNHSPGAASRMLCIEGKSIAASKPVVHLPECEDAFNADIVCVHGNLRVEERCKQLISREVWFRLCTYFNNPTTFQFGVKPCGLCKEEASKEFLLREKCKEEANRQKARLTDLFAGIERPKWSKSHTKRVYLISSEFVHAWRAYCKGISSGKALPGEGITDVNNNILLCPHKGLFHAPSLNWENYPDPSCVMLREEEWSAIKEMFKVDVEVMVEKDTSQLEPVLISTPPVCHKCLKTKAEAEHESRLNYTNQALYVTYLTQDEEIPSEELNDPEFYTSIEGIRGSGYGQRRSTRRKRGRGEKQFVVSSDTLLRDLKVQIMEVFKVAPFDQILFLNGEYLNDNTQSLGSLGVLPGSSIFLKADQSVPCEPEDWTNPHPEQGFKGTGLLSA